MHLHHLETHLKKQNKTENEMDIKSNSLCIYFFLFSKDLILIISFIRNARVLVTSSSLDKASPIVKSTGE